MIYKNNYEQFFKDLKKKTGSYLNIIFQRYRYHKQIDNRIFFTGNINTKTLFKSIKNLKIKISYFLMEIFSVIAKIEIFYRNSVF